MPGGCAMGRGWSRACAVLACATGLWAAGAGVALAAQSLGGRVDLVPARGQTVLPGEVAEGVVYFLPAEAGARPRPGRFSIDTHSKGFLPATLVVPAGSVVAFPNRDQILHNVYSNSPAATFDLGTYGGGEVRETRLPRAGLVQVNCNVHQGMRANVLVLDTPHHVRPGPDGRFDLRNLPDGGGLLVFWHPRARAESRKVEAAGGDFVVRLTATRPRIGATPAVRP